MKALFLKQAESCGGPWASFNYSEVNPNWILSKTYSKAGHPIPMIINMKMDCRIIKGGPKQNWIEVFRGRNKRYDEILGQYTEGVCSFNDIEYNNYDLIWCEDAFVPDTIITKHSSIIWAFNNAEHCFPTRNDSYHIFFDHERYSFPHDGGVLKEIFSTNDSESIFIEWRTIQIQNIVEIIEKNTGIRCNFDLNPVSNQQMLTNPPTDGNVYWKRLGGSKYYLQLPVNGNYRLGQAFVDAASLGLICIGNCRKNQIIHPKCRVDNVFSAIDIVRLLDKNAEMSDEILNYQNEYLKKINIEFSEIINKGN